MMHFLIGPSGFSPMCTINIYAWTIAYILLDFGDAMLIQYFILLKIDWTSDSVHCRGCGVGWQINSLEICILCGFLFDFLDQSAYEKLKTSPRKLHKPKRYYFYNANHK